MPPTQVTIRARLSSEWPGRFGPPGVTLCTSQVPGGPLNEMKIAIAKSEKKTVALLEDPVQRKTLGAAGRRLVEARFAWASIARKFAARCDEVVSAEATR